MYIIPRDSLTEWLVDDADTPEGAWDEFEEPHVDETGAPNLLGAMMEADEWLSASPLLFSLLNRPGELRTAKGLFPVGNFELENTDPPVQIIIINYFSVF